MNSSLHHAPYIRHPESSRTLMSDVVIALVPLYFMSYFYYGFRVIAVGAAAVLTCLLSDWLCCFLTYRQSAGFQPHCHRSDYLDADAADH